MKVLFPDPCWHPGIITGASFLYFHKEKLSFSLYPSVSTLPLTRINPIDYFKFVADQKPAWHPSFILFTQLCAELRTGFGRTQEVLEPLLDTGFNLIMFGYDRGDAAWEAGQDLIAASSQSFTEITRAIDPHVAADELFSHIFLEKFLELYEDTSIENLRRLGEQARQADPDAPPRTVDWRPLYEYCDQLFTSGNFEEILTTAYMFRLPSLRVLPAVLLSNPRLVEFLCSLPIRANPKQAQVGVELDGIAWEFFRQLISTRVDPLDANAVQTIRRLRSDHPSEIEALKNRCASLASELSEEKDLARLQDRIADHIRAKVQNEVESLLFVDKAAANNFLDTVFGDKATWASIATLLFSLAQGGPLLTAAGAIGTIATVGSAAVKAAAERRKTLEASDFALLYRMTRS